MLEFICLILGYRLVTEEFLSRSAVAKKIRDLAMHECYLVISTASSRVQPAWDRDHNRGSQIRITSSRHDLIAYQFIQPLGIPVWIFPDKVIQYFHFTLKLIIK